MKRFSYLFGLAIVLTSRILASPIFLDPIPVSGSGTWGWDYGLGTFENFTASGTNGSNTLSMSIQTLTEWPLPINVTTFGMMDPCSTSGSLTINGITGVPHCLGTGQYVFSLPFDNIASIYEPNGFYGPLIIEAPLIGYLNVTSYIESYRGEALTSIRATFVIVPTYVPEPSLFFPVGFLTAVFCFRIFRSWIPGGLC